MITTVKDNNMALAERKNASRIRAERITEARRNQRISLEILVASSVRMKGRPLK